MSETGLAPMAKDTICVDFDGTLYPWAPLFARVEPHEGAVEAVKALKRAGFRIVIFTSRLSPKWLHAEYESFSAQYNYVQDMLLRDDIPFDEITAEKVPARWYIDDRAIAFRGDSPYGAGAEWLGIAGMILNDKDGVRP